MHFCDFFLSLLRLSRACLGKSKSSCVCVCFHSERKVRKRRGGGFLPPARLRQSTSTQSHFLRPYSSTASGRALEGHQQTPLPLLLPYFLLLLLLPAVLAAAHHRQACSPPPLSPPPSGRRRATAVGLAGWRARGSCRAATQLPSCLDRAQRAKTHHSFFECFSYVCPEPVLLNGSFSV